MRERKERSQSVGDDTTTFVISNYHRRLSVLRFASMKNWVRSEKCAKGAFLQLHSWILPPHRRGTTKLKRHCMHDCV